MTITDSGMPGRSDLLGINKVFLTELIEMDVRNANFNIGIKAINELSSLFFNKDTNELECDIDESETCLPSYCLISIRSVPKGSDGITYSIRVNQGQGVNVIKSAGDVCETVVLDSESLKVLLKGVASQMYQLTDFNYWHRFSYILDKLAKIDLNSEGSNSPI